MTSPRKKSPAAYADVKFVLDMALNKPGLRYILKTYGAAVNFKQRCYTYRNLIREMTAETLQGIPGVRAETAYDKIVIKQINEANEFDRKGCVLVFEHIELDGRLIDETGEEIQLPGITDVIREQ